MDKTATNGAELAYEVRGTGDPVVFIHGAFIADAFRPLLADPSLADRFRLILYHRRGYADSSPVSEIISVALQAADCRELLRNLGIDRAHVVGHSYGGAVALQLTLDSPELVHSLALLEPALMVGETARNYRASLARGVDRYREAGAATAVDEFLKARSPGYESVLNSMLPEAFEQAVNDAATAFECELSGLLDWRFGEAEARHINQPILSVLGGNNQALWPRFGETHRTLLSWLPHAEGFVLPGATHFLQVEDPRGMARALADFWARHPIAAQATS